MVNSTEGGSFPELPDVDDQDLTVDRSLDEYYCPVCDQSCQQDGATFCPKDGAKLVLLAEKQDSLLGRVLDERFTIKAKIGAGGMGSVYRALQHSVGRQVAIKIIEPRLAGNRDIIKRFLREAQLASRLSQPNTVSVLDFGQTGDGLLYLVMELDGKSLEEVLRRDGALSEERVIRIGVQISDALDAARAFQIVHRDLKPANVVVLDDPPGRDMIKVLDFGIAKSLAKDSGITTMTQSDMIMGTPSYIAPEAIAGERVDQRADLYSVGIMLYEMTTGVLPFDAKTINSMLSAHSTAPPRPLPESVSPGLRAIIERLLSKSPADRFQTPADLRYALGNVQTGRAGAALAKTAAAPSTSGPAVRGEEAAVALAETAATPASLVTGNAGPGTTAEPEPAVSATPEPTTAAIATKPAPRQRALKGLWIGLGLTVAGGGAVLAAVLLIGSEPAGSEPTTLATEDLSSEAGPVTPAIDHETPHDPGRPTPASIADAAPAAADAPVKPALVMTVTSEPSGARVLLFSNDDNIVGLPCTEGTPCGPIEITNRHLVENGFQIETSKRGYRPHRERIAAGETNIVRHVTLQKRRGGGSTTKPEPEPEHKDEQFLKAKPK